MWRELMIKCGVTGSGAQPDNSGNPVPDNPNFLFSAQQIQHLLCHAQKSMSMVSLLFKGEQDQHTSHVLHIFQQQRQFLLRRPHAEIDTPFPRINHMFNLTLPHQNNLVLLSSKIEQAIEWNQHPCYVVNIPTALLTTEMRCFARVRLSLQHAPDALIHIDEMGTLRSPLQDICENGFRIKTHAEKSKSLKTATRLLQAQLAIPEVGVLDLQVKIRACVEKSNNLEVGFEIISLSEKAAQSLRRYVMKCTASQVHTVSELDIRSAAKPS